MVVKGMEAKFCRPWSGAMLLFKYIYIFNWRTFIRGFKRLTQAVVRKKDVRQDKDLSIKTRQEVIVIVHARDDGILDKGSSSWRCEKSNSKNILKIAAKVCS